MNFLVDLDKRCFKIDELNARTMIFGYLKNGKRVYQAIWCATFKKKQEIFYRLMTFYETPKRFKRSNIGQKLESESLTILMKYIVKLDNIYHIENDISLYEIICNNGLFDIWHPEAPYDRFYESKNVKKDPSTYCKILLLRVYEIHEELKEHDLCRTDRYDHLRSDCSIGNNRTVVVKNPVISDTEFNKIKFLLEDSIKDYQLS